MFFKVIQSYMLGYVNICVEGYFIERFINICISKNLFLWNVKRQKSTIMYANVRIKEFKELKQIARKTKCRVSITSKKGAPFVLHRYKKRKLFGAFLILIFLVILGMSNFVWNIEITGNDTIQTEELMETLNKNGLNIGVLKNKVDTKQLINDIRLNRDDVAWVGVQMKGTNAIVKVVEADAKPEIINKEDYCNIVSDKDGVITKITAKNGTLVMNVGDVIRKGDILIGGWMEGKYTGTRYVHSEGEILAKVWYSKKEKMSFNQQIQVKTGKEEKKYSIRINKFKINLYKSIPKFQKYDTINASKKLKLFSDFYLPIEMLTDTYLEEETMDVTYNKEELTKMLTENIEESLKQEVSDYENVVNRQVNVNEVEDGIEVEVIYEVLENIGTKEKIVF